jgi:2-phosphoglycolate phosphatase
MSALILFDFDGTLADTAPDLVAAANHQRTRRGMETLPYEQLRPLSSQGARGLLRGALGFSPDHPEYETTRLQFLKDYAASSTVSSRLFPGIAELLDTIRQRELAWGIVTNKAAHLALPIVEFLGLTEDSAAIVCGDTTAYAKPHPLPLQHAAEIAGFDTKQCIYVGDDLRDVQAAHAAGMPAIAAAYGYLGQGEEVASWAAEAIVYEPSELWTAIESLLPSNVR